MKKWLLVLVLLLGISAYAATAESTSQSRTFHFPTDKSLGQLKIRDCGSQRWRDWKDYGYARGDVLVREGKEMQLTIIFEAFANRFLLRTLNLNSAGISGEALQRLRQALPDRTLYFRKESSAYMTKPPYRCIIRISDVQNNGPTEKI